MSLLGSGRSLPLNRRRAGFPHRRNRIRKIKIPRGWPRGFLFLEPGGSEDPAELFIKAFRGVSHG